MARFNVEALQDMFQRVEKKELTKQDVAKYYGTSVGAVNNYFCAKRAYDQGRHVCAQNVSVKVFTQWAIKYGGKGEPVYKVDPHPERKHIKKEPEQQVMILPDADQCEKETIEICGLVIEISIKTKARKQ